MAQYQPPPTAFAGPAQRRERKLAPVHVSFVKTLPCLSCGRVDHSDPHHVKLACPEAAKVTAGTMRPDDMWLVPLCRKCHNLAHSRTERVFWGELTVNPHFVALALWAFSGDYDVGVQIIQANR